MKKRRIKLLIGCFITSASIICIAYLCNVFFTNAAVTPKYPKDYASTQEYINVLREESFEDLVAEVNKIGTKCSYEDLTYYAQALQEKRAGISDAVLEELYFAKSSSLYLKRIILEFSMDENQPILLDFDRVSRDFLKEKDVEQRMMILSYLGSGCTYANDERYAELIGSMLSTEKDDIILSRLISSYYYIDKEKTISICNSILNNFNASEITYTQRQALTRIAWSLQDGTEEEIEKFILLCDDMLRKTGDADAVCYPLVETYQPAAVKYVLKNDKFDDMLKSGCVYKNYNALCKIANMPASEENYRLIAYAMRLTPLIEMEEQIDLMISNNKTFLNEHRELLQELNDAIAMIRQSGIHHWNWENPLEEKT